MEDSNPAFILQLSRYYKFLLDQDTLECLELPCDRTLN